MTQWESEKREAQMSFIMPESGVETPDESIQSLYQEILTTGSVASLSNESLTQQILNGAFREPGEPEVDIVRDLDRDMEPER